MNDRLGPVDALKAFACVLIVWHHLAFYGPMSDLARPLAPAVVDWLYTYGRMAVQLFLVVSGFLLARGVGPGRPPSKPWPEQVGRRYLRLLVPYAAALVLAILVADVVRASVGHPDAPGTPTWTQLLAHLLMVQDLVGEESLSAGVWYVAIDLQLFALATLLCRLPGQWSVVAVAALTAASLLWCNLDPRLDATALYFFGAYGLGLLAGWAARGPRPWACLAAVALLGIVALALGWRDRIAVAWVCALGLGALQATGAMDWQPPRWMAWLAAISYPVFLVHFAVLLAVGSLWAWWWPDGPLVHALGMGVAFGLSLLAGAGLHRMAQGIVRPRAALGWQVAVLAAGLVAMAV
ncbi:acyltransferase family protein [Pseudorhodoferax soli]|uniref:Peptidoglycan/LPS O-acetylase OafA/YrhL n=1 Tax=Pseudorhodoferax soli TaxID=545864 RepID=A0A368Y461_9BURK|nr:acyltransferase [Pseudorhodoferax soli]RCW73014.1 peptidoglycan/LPS O-acetylase OafA/YrhL [Pseudorhodoferax soli]